MMPLNPPELGAAVWDSFVPDSMKGSEELLRRARLHIRFGWLGAVFGTVYALFYLLIGHWQGSAIIVICSALVGFGPWLLKQRANLQYTGHYYSAILVMGFSALCLVEGGLQGHAIAWLAGIPLCSLLLLNLSSALAWSAVCFATTLLFGSLERAGIHCPSSYPPEWHIPISIMGYCGLVCFMTLLGVTFERTRARAFKQMEVAMSKLAVANQHLSKLNEEKDEFMKIAAHDLNNPLCGILGYTELMIIFETQSRSEVLERAQAIRGLSQRMLEIIKNLLEVRRIEEGSMQMNLIRCNADYLLSGILRDHGRSAELKRIKLEYHPFGEPCQALADQGAVQQILDNLVSNAIKYSPRNTTVHCSCREEAGVIHLDVRDEGPGLSEEDQQKLFKKFSKLTPRPTGGENSNGLGLWIVQRMAQCMNGNVSCTTLLGHGCTFSLTLPKWQPAESPRAASKDLTRDQLKDILLQPRAAAEG